jgi:hypothetical protein
MHTLLGATGTTSWSWTRTCSCLIAFSVAFEVVNCLCYVVRYHASSTTLVEAHLRCNRRNLLRSILASDS